MPSILFTQFEVARILEGHGMVLRDDAYQAEYYVRTRYSEDNEVIDAKDLPVVWVEREHLRSVAAGRAATAYVSRGAVTTTTITLRLATLAEFREGMSKSTEWFRANNLDVPPEPADEDIIPLLTPLEGI